METEKGSLFSLIAIDKQQWKIAVSANGPIYDVRTVQNSAVPAPADNYLVHLLCTVVRNT
jgi:hypothetical protein